MHDALETIVKAIISAGCESVQSPEAVAALRRLGGYTAVIERAAECRLASLPDNPRLDSDLLQRFQRGLRGRIADARLQVQAYISSAVIASAEKPRGTWVPVVAGSSGGILPSVSLGSHAEVTLTAPKLRLTGRLDLLRVTDVGAHITDYKTGAENPGHATQLRLYALLWDLDRAANPNRRPANSLTAAYPDHDVAIPVPGESELRDIERQVATSIDEADAELTADVPRPVPSAEHCGSCGVRHLCDAYWATIAPDPSDLPDGTKFDCQGLVGAQNGQHSWWFHTDGSRRERFLLQVPQSGSELHPGRRVRILGLRIDASPDSTVTVASMSAFSEVFQLTSTP